MTLFTIVGDPHAKPDNLDKINTLFDIVEDLGNTVIFLGDMLDTKELVRASCLNTYLRRMQDSKLNYWVLVGNHDWFNLKCEQHALEALKALPNITVVDKLTQYGKDLVFLPYMHDLELLKESLKSCAGKTVFCHADIKGFDFGNGLISEAGLDLADFSLVKAAISGHYHKYQKVGKLTYLGTPFSHSYGESNQDKYIGVFDTNSGNMDLYPTPFPKHTTIELDCAKYSGHHYNEVDHIRVILKGTQEEIDRVTREEGIKYIEKPTEVVKASIINESDTPEVQFKKWARDIKGYTDDVLNLGLEILKNV